MSRQSAHGRSAERPALIVGGGVGPMAGVRLHEHIIHSIPATEGDHGHLDVWHLAEVSRLVDRSEFLAGGAGSNPGEVMARNVVDIGRVISARGGRWIAAVPCATFHAPPIYDRFLDLVLPSAGCLAVISMVDATVQHLRAQRLGRIGVLSTRGAHRAGVWRSPLQEAGFTVLEGSAAMRASVHDAIYNPRYGLKCASPPTEAAGLLVEQAGRELLEDGAEALLLGCTELPLIAPQLAPVVGQQALLCDPLRLLAQSCVRRCVTDDWGRTGHERYADSPLLAERYAEMPLPPATGAHH